VKIKKMWDSADGYELADSLAERNRRAIWGAMKAPGEDVAISRDSLPLASRGFRLVERV
jgi:hypothetical protein